jgi:hypothetical protein
MLVETNPSQKLDVMADVVLAYVQKLAAGGAIAAPTSGRVTQVP